jgi:hypothetical protein
MRSRHEREVELLETRLRKKNAADSKSASRKLGIFSRRPARKKSLAGRASRNNGSWKQRNQRPATIFKSHRGGLAADKYAEESKGAQLLFTNMLSTSWKDRMDEWNLDQATHLNVSNLFQHVSISRPEGHSLGTEQWKLLLLDWLREIGAEGVNFTAVHHSNTKNDHIHIVFSRALPNGKLLSDSQNFYKWRAALRCAEERNGLKSLPIEYEVLVNQSDRQVSANRRALRRGTRPNFIDPQVIEAAAARSTDFQSMADDLRNLGIEIQISRRNDGTPRGILFRQAGSDEFLAGTSISRELSLNKIQLRFNQNIQIQMHQAQKRIEAISRNQIVNRQPRQRGE